MAALTILKTRARVLGLVVMIEVVAVQAVAAVGRGLATRAQWNLLRYVPGFPGRLGGLVRKNIRELLSALDVYVAVLLSLGGIAYRLFEPHPDRFAFPILSLLVALAMSTYGQCLFGLELASAGMTRYRLLPLRGWEVLLAKDAAVLGILILLVLPLDPWPGTTFALTALAIGHYSSCCLPAPQQRWRFTGSRLFPALIQGIGGMLMGFAEVEAGRSFLVLSAAGYVVSLRFFGGVWERR